MGSHDICDVSECVEKSTGGSHNFCCCYSDLCNENFTKAKDRDPEKSRLTAEKRVHQWSGGLNNGDIKGYFYAFYLQQHCV